MMPPMRNAAVGSILLLSLCCCSLVSAEESDGTAARSINLAGYKTKHDVLEHAHIDKDMSDIETAMKKKDAAGYTEALKIYSSGKNSKLGTGGMRTLAMFWPGAHKNSLGLPTDNEPFLKMFDAYAAHKTFNPHDGAVKAMEGADSAQGPYKTNRVASEWDFRDQVSKKNIAFQVVMIYALHELEVAVEAYGAGQAKDIGQRYLDVWWAFYVGSMESGDGVKGFGPYVLAERRSKFFATGTSTIGNGGVSKVNDILLKATVEISRLMSTDGNIAPMRNIMKCVRAQLKVPLIQGCVMYGMKLPQDLLACLSCRDLTCIQCCAV